MVGKRLSIPGGRELRGGPTFVPSAVNRALESFLAGEDTALDALVRSEVLESWSHSAEHVAPVTDHAPVISEAVERWRSTRMASAFQAIAGELEDVAAAGDFVAAVTDEQGVIVWVAGGRTMRRRAEAVGFAPGGRWSEDAVGTNALGVALRTGRPSAIRATEHFSPIVQNWVCYSAPILNPNTGRPAGVLDLSTTWSRANPLALSTVSAMARNLELMLRASPHERRLQLRVLGGGDVLLDGVVLPLAPRQVELVTVLSLHPGGLTLETLHELLHLDGGGSIGSTKAEISYLRRHLGDMLLSRPYRLAEQCGADHLDALVALREGRVDDALTLYRGPLLPRSQCWAIEEHRAVLESAIRGAVVNDPTPARVAAARAAIPYDTYLADLADAKRSG